MISPLGSRPGLVLPLTVGALAACLAVLTPTDLPLTGGWTNPVMAMELATTPADLAFLAGPEQAGTRTLLRWVHVVDAVFPAAYAGLMALVGLRAGQRGVAGAALVALLTDWIENATLLHLFDQLDAQADLTAALPVLHVATWAKWGAIATGFGLLASGRSAPWFPRLLFGTATVATLVAFLSGPTPAAGEAMGGAVVAGFVGLAWVAWRGERRPAVVRPG